jgi:hypothetical protein
MEGSGWNRRLSRRLVPSSVVSPPVGGPELSSFVGSELSPLLDHDATAKLQLAPTFGGLPGTRRHEGGYRSALQVERRTLCVRIARIERLPGRSLGRQGGPVPLSSDDPAP